MPVEFSLVAWARLADLFLVLCAVVSFFSQGGLYMWFLPEANEIRIVKNKN
jgi:hypothetical protein